MKYLVALVAIMAISLPAVGQETVNAYPIQHAGYSPMGTGHQGTPTGWMSPNIGGPGMRVERNNGGNGYIYHGYARFDLSELGIGFEDIISVALHYNVTGPDARELRFIAITNTDSIAGMVPGQWGMDEPNPLFHGAFGTHSDAGATVAVDGPGWYNAELNALVGLAALEIGMGNGWLGIGIQAVDDESEPNFNTTIAGRPWNAEDPDETTPYLEITYGGGAGPQPADFVLTLPEDEAFDVPVTGARFEWESADPAEEGLSMVYDLYLVEAPGDPQTLLEPTVAGLTGLFWNFNLEDPLKSETGYNWNVNARLIDDETEELVGEKFATDDFSFTTEVIYVWDDLASLPTTGTRRDVISRGSWLAYDGDGSIYAHKGNRTREIYVYDIAGESWTQLEVETPLDTVRNRPTGLGSRAVIVGTDLYLVHGNNTGAFWKLSLSPADEDPWAPWVMLADIPGRIVRGGGDLAYHDGTIYFLKGDRTEFLRYDIAGDEWTPLANAPGNRWLRDSWLAADETGTIYAHMARFFDRTVEHRNDWAHYLYSYNGGWSEATDGMPLLGPVGRRQRRRRAGEGGSGVFYDGSLYALKGGNTQQLWQYDITGATWQHLVELPLLGEDGRRRVNAGGFLTVDGDGVLYALKGNRTNEFWKYAPVVEDGVLAFQPRPDRSGAMAEELPTGQAFVRIGPNPLAGGMATLRYNLPQAGPAQLKVFDVTGRNVLSRSITTAQTGAVSLDLRNLSAGIYLLQVEAGGFTGMQKLVVQQ